MCNLHILSFREHKQTHCELTPDVFEKCLEESECTSATNVFEKCSYDRVTEALSEGEFLELDFSSSKILVPKFWTSRAYEAP